MNIFIIFHVMCGALCVISAPSGAGKSTLIQALMQSHCYLSDIRLSISYTTRVKRPGEVDGKDYYFISKKDFEYMIHANIFFEYARVFNYYYGTSKNDIRNMLSAGAHVILDIDWNGAKQVRNKILKNVYTIFILPPSKKVLEDRLRSRAQDTEKTIFLRMQEAISIINHVIEYDYVVINDNFDIALRHLQSIILSEQLRFTYQTIRYEKLINNLLKSN